MSLSRSLLAAALVSILAPAPGAHAGEDGFTGAWRRNLEEFEGGPNATPSPMDATVAVEGDQIHVVINNHDPETGDETIKWTYKPSKKPYTVPGGQGRTRDVTMKWSGDKVVVKYTFKAQNMDAEAVETWRLRKGGKQIFVKTSFRLPVGTFVSKDYWDRVE